MDTAGVAFAIVGEFGLVFAGTAFLVVEEEVFLVLSSPLGLGKSFKRGAEDDEEFLPLVT